MKLETSMSSSLIAKRYISSARFKRPMSATETIIKKNSIISNPNYIIVIDTETTGLFNRNANPENYELFNNARVVEIAWEIFKPNGDFVNRESYIIKPDRFIIPDNAIAIHGITNEMANNTGHNIQDVFERLNVVLKDVSTIVAHNFSYDNAIILAELYRLNENNDGLNLYNNIIYDWINKEHKCTMLMGKNIMGPNTCKWYKLGELYRICFNTDPDVLLHRAAADVAICSKIYFYLIQRPATLIT